jgi:UDP:flavonoid glycosyltransferase YjiC (YdhE family)
MLNQRELLSQGIDIYFNHCGAGSIYESLYYGIPGVYIPQHFDQFKNAETLAGLGCGLV